MGAVDEQVEAVARLWDAHLRAEFPAQLRGAELAGADMVLLDADVAGCVSTWLQTRGHLDDWRTGLLMQCVNDLDRVLPLLAGAGAFAYYERLRVMAVAALGGPLPHMQRPSTAGPQPAAPAIAGRDRQQAEHGPEFAQSDDVAGDDDRVLR